MVLPSDETGTIPGPTVPSGPSTPGAGVLGRGGVPIPPEGPVAAGVIGLAGGMPIPNISETGNTGVYGVGLTGVVGRGDGGPGVHGLANRDRGGIFESGEKGAEPIAQLRLVPLPRATPSELPKRGLPGDIFVRQVIGGNREPVLEILALLEGGRGRANSYVGTLSNWGRRSSPNEIELWISGWSRACPEESIGLNWIFGSKQPTHFYSSLLLTLECRGRCKKPRRR